jgi:hypothetical protein
MLRRGLIFVGWVLGAGIFIPAHAQYPGRVDPNKGTAAVPVLRATAVLEYTGDLTRPTAARLIPVAVWDGERYQPGGLYMAQPMPMAVESGTQYELLDAGLSKGLFDVKAAANVSGSWIATGSYQKPLAPKVSKLKTSKTLPQLVKDVGSDDGKPHFAHRPSDSGSGSSSSGSGSGSGTTTGSGSGSGSGGASTSASGTAPATDSDGPTLHRRTNTTTGEQTGSGSSSGSGSNTASKPAPEVDPDRPTLHRPPAAATNPNDNGAPVSATTNVDPDRPRLQHGRPADLESLDVPSTVAIAKLAGGAPNLKLIAAVSDIKTREPHSYVYSWSDPEDAKKMQAALEDMAKNLLAGNALKSSVSGQTFGASKTTTQKTGAQKTATTATTTHGAHKAAPKPVLPDLADEQFKAYELSFGGGATLVFSAKTGQGDATKYVTIIAQPDFNGVPQVLFKQVTRENELDVIPRMQLVDAVDTDADNRAELIFELAGKSDQQFAIYRVADRAVEQVFSTGGSE